MTNMLHYKDYMGTVVFSEEDGVFHGKIIGISDSISYEGDSVKSLINDFHTAIDEYLDFCAEVSKIPEKCSFTDIPKYEIAIWWSKEDNRYLAEVPELPGCMADGETLNEVTENVERIIREWIECAVEDGKIVPEPIGRLKFA